MTHPEVVGGYRRIGELGRGGMGAVYEAQPAMGGEPVALKVIDRPDPNLLLAIDREIRALSRVSHPGIVRIVGYGVDGGLPWCAMEIVRGSTLAEVRAGGPDLPTLLTLVRRLCSPLGYLHGEGIIHRDLKPENVIVAENGMPVLVDFGLSMGGRGATGGALGELRSLGHLGLHLTGAGQRRAGGCAGATCTASVCVPLRPGGPASPRSPASRTLRC